jgi:hypothetical protein
MKEITGREADDLIMQNACNYVCFMGGVENGKHLPTIVDANGKIYLIEPNENLSEVIKKAMEIDSKKFLDK